MTNGLRFLSRILKHVWLGLPLALVLMPLSASAETVRIYVTNSAGDNIHVINPATNAVYAARFLNRLHASGDDWSRAIGAYHSETLALGDAYRVMVMLRWNGPNVRFASAVQPAAYQAFQPAEAVYGSFASAGQAYGAFAKARR